MLSPHWQPASPPSLSTARYSVFFLLQAFAVALYTVAAGPRPRGAEKEGRRAGHAWIQPLLESEALR
jgi:hypothetical protein